MDNLELLLTLRPDPYLVIRRVGRGLVVSYADAGSYTFTGTWHGSLSATLAEADKAAAELIEEITRKGEEE